jgi:chromosome segregation ATPase
MEPRISLEPQLSYGRRNDSQLHTALEKLRADYDFSQKINEEMLTQLTQVEMSLQQAQAKLASTEHELTALQREHSNLSTELQQSRQKFDDLIQQWETRLQQTQQHVEAGLKEKFRETRHQLEQRCQQAEARARDLETQINTTPPQVNTQELEGLKAAHTKEMEDARRMVNFYKCNAEKVSKKNQEIVAENRMLQKTIDLQSTGGMSRVC